MADAPSGSERIFYGNPEKGSVKRGVARTRRRPSGDEVEEVNSRMKKAYKRPKLEVFGKVTELTLNACNNPGADGKFCRNLDEIGRTTPGSDNAGFPKP